MRIPTIKGVIDRRILVNYRIAPEVMTANLPAPFKPKLVHGFAIGGICLIRLKQIRPKFFPFPFGIQSENAAHRIAVEWDVDGQTQEGVYIPRRDTNSRLNSLAGGSIFPGIHHHSSFEIEETDDFYSVTMSSNASSANVHVSGTAIEHMPATSIFETVAQVSDFFEKGSLGYSDTHKQGQYDGLELRCSNWHVQPFQVEKVESSYFENRDMFPKGSVEFDCALLMLGINHEWHSREEICCGN